MPPSTRNGARAGGLARPSSPTSACSMNDPLYFAQFGGAPVRASATNSLLTAIDRVSSKRAYRDTAAGDVGKTISASSTNGTIFTSVERITRFSRNAASPECSTDDAQRKICIQNGHFFWPASRIARVPCLGERKLTWANEK